MDILYYSNYDQHSAKVLQFLVKGNLMNEINAICIDKRKRDARTNQILILLETGQTVYLPPNIHSVPALLLVNKNYQLVLGNDIIRHYEPKIKEKLASVNFGNGEPLGYSMGVMSGSGGSNIVSEQFTFFNMSPEELSAKGRGGSRQMYNYVTVGENPNSYIQTPPDTYKPNKLSNGITIESLEQQRNMDIPQQDQTQPQMQYQNINNGF
jgi:hypothetical protein